MPLRFLSQLSKATIAIPIPSFKTLTLTSIPEELLLHIAFHLDEPELYLLGQVSDGFGRITTEEISRRLRIDEVRWGGVALPDAWSMITQQPDLAKKVRELEINVEYIDRPYGFFSDVVDDFKIPYHLGQTWNREGSQKSSIELSGVMIMMMSGLKHLCLAPNSVLSWTPYRPAFGGDPLLRLFGCDPITGDILKVPGLQQLRSLSLSHVRVSWPWFTLPKLRDVYIDAKPGDINKDNKPFEKSNVTTLGLRLCDHMLGAGESYLQIYQDFLRHFARLGELSITVGVDQRGSSLGPSDWSYLIGTLSFLGPTLETLRIREEEAVLSSRDAWIEGTDYHQCFLGFHRLRLLALPQHMLLGGNYRGARGKPLRMKLPASIEVLEIWHPTNYITAWLTDLWHELASFPNLSMVKLRCGMYQYGQGVSSWTLMRTDELSALRRAFLDEGVVVEPVEGMEPFNEDWLDPAYDPESALLVTWLEELFPNAIDA